MLEFVGYLPGLSEASLRTEERMNLIARARHANLLHWFSTHRQVWFEGSCVKVYVLFIRVCSAYASPVILPRSDITSGSTSQLRYGKHRDMTADREQSPIISSQSGRMGLDIL